MSFCFLTHTLFERQSINAVVNKANLLFRNVSFIELPYTDQPA